jgi:hypothetical protein
MDEAERSPFGLRLLESANPESQVKAAEEIFTAADSSNDPQHAFKKACASNGTALALTKALEDTEDDSVAEKVCGAIMNVTISAEGQAACVKAGSEKVITAVLQTTKDDRVREWACLAIVNIAVYEEGAACVVAGAPAAVVSVLKATKDDEVMRQGSWALMIIAWSNSESPPAF